MCLDSMRLSPINFHEAHWLRHPFTHSLTHSSTRSLTHLLARSRLAHACCFVRDLAVALCATVAILQVLIQAAFKRPVAGSGPEVTAVDSSMDWDAVKPEDRTLIEQVSLFACCSYFLLAQSPRLICCSRLPVLSCIG